MVTVMVMVLTATTLYAESVAERYDANNDGAISRVEINAAIFDFIDGVIDVDQLLEVAVVYFSGGSPAMPTPTPTPTPEPVPAHEDPPEPTETLSEMIERVRPSVVRISSDADAAIGSGMIYRTEGQTAFIVTNQHVASSWPLTVTVGDAVDYPGYMMGFLYIKDLALIAICCGDFTVAKFADSELLNVGDEVIAIGYPIDSV